MEISKVKDFSNFYDYSELNSQKDNASTSECIPPFFTDIEPILKTEKKSYLCNNCFTFPFIELNENKKYIYISCSCFHNKEILIKDYIDKLKEVNPITDISYTGSLVSTFTEVNENEEGLKCRKHNFKFEYFCETCLLNLCKKCKFSHESFPHKVFGFKSIQIDNEKLKKLISYINPIDVNDLELKEKIHVNKYYHKDQEHIEKVTEGDEEKFKKLIRIIIKDYKLFPNYLHFLNLENIFHFNNFINNKKIADNDSHDNNNITIFQINIPVTYIINFAIIREYHIYEKSHF